MKEGLVPISTSDTSVGGSLTSIWLTILMETSYSEGHLKAQTLATFR